LTHDCFANEVTSDPANTNTDYKIKWCAYGVYDAATNKPTACYSCHTGFKYTSASDGATIDGTTAYCTSKVKKDGIILADGTTFDDT